MTASVSHIGGVSSRNRAIVRRIKEKMGGLDVAKQGLGEITGLNRVTIGRRLSGVSSFTIDELDLIAGALQVNLDWLLTGHGDPTPPAAGTSLHLQRSRVACVSPMRQSRSSKPRSLSIAGRCSAA